MHLMYVETPGYLPTDEKYLKNLIPNLSYCKLLSEHSAARNWPQGVQLAPQRTTL